ncbi:hypothetical protein SAMN04488125_102243 [Methylorubrum salsuginis]|uniref:Uncharacterized protein n=1 Tax=Methylorubrum salsuginis TaxID=414703 RepID=A0A1I4A6M8_9HYPH|nr:hypothetical protein SAMN04488125_102243 [Methylorubrum salsuginis]
MVPVHCWFPLSLKAGMAKRHAHGPRDRQPVGREASPTGSILYAQLARLGVAGVKGKRGCDPVRRVVGLKRNTLTDTDGCL